MNLPEKLEVDEKGLRYSGYIVAASRKVNGIETCHDEMEAELVRRYNAHKGLVKLIDLHDEGMAATNACHELHERADGEGWANDPTGSCHLADANRRMGEAWKNFEEAVNAAKEALKGQK